MYCKIKNEMWSVLKKLIDKIEKWFFEEVRQRKFKKPTENALNLKNKTIKQLGTIIL